MLLEVMVAEVGKTPASSVQLGSNRLPFSSAHIPSLITLPRHSRTSFPRSSRLNKRTRTRSVDSRQSIIAPSRKLLQV